MTGVLNVDTIADNAGTGPVTLTKQSAAKQYLSFNASGGNLTNISLNVSSVTDNGTGDFTASYTNNFDASQPVVHLASNLASSANPGKYVYALGTSSHRVYPYRSTAGGMTEGSYIGTTALGDLA